VARASLVCQNPGAALAGVGAADAVPRQDADPAVSAATMSGDDAVLAVAAAATRAGAPVPAGRARPADRPGRDGAGRLPLPVLQRPEHSMDELGQHLRRGVARQRCSVAHPPTVSRFTFAGSTLTQDWTYVRLMSDMAVSEQQPERCRCGNVYGAGEYLVGWLPCGCTVGHTGHRTYWCQHCGHVLEIPPCLRIAVGTSEVLGIARPNWQFHPDPER